jgi:hypothetical protein
MKWSFHENANLCVTGCYLLGTVRVYGICLSGWRLGHDTVPGERYVWYVDATQPAGRITSCYTAQACDDNYGCPCGTSSCGPAGCASGDDYGPNHGSDYGSGGFEANAQEANAQEART